ncbi:enoyl-CoA hydratase/isomerase family protein [Solicola gregarius]|uniref:Enoyl-CoA hydratase/isomerase family protein n=1 Tax=Solicola gregarius TaxID=2908642 RepID=A0AA46TJ73_9ACTN|nr:enoyl-CoA hydratase/isomerase family protein [Solicola gregarius]UYM06301.1 enoyl-CoA hydratase/isomerase family protein [Solicola gregarius]
MANQSATLTTEQHGPIATLRLNRPQVRNALNPALIADLDAAMDAAEGDPETACIVLLGAGRSFSAGADLRHLLALHEQGRSPVPFLRDVSAVATRLEASPKPTLAAIHGHAVAGGMELALACDVALASETAQIGDGHVRNGLLPGGGASLRLPEKVGAALSRWLALTGDLVPAHRLAEAGWLHSVVPDARLEQAAYELASVLCASSGPAQSNFKQLLTDQARRDSDPHRELAAFERHWRSHDVPGVLRRFLRERTSTDRPIKSSRKV